MVTKTHFEEIDIDFVVQVGKTFGLLVEAEVGIGFAVARANGLHHVIFCPHAALGDAIAHALVRRVRESPAFPAVSDHEFSRRRLRGVGSS